AGAELIGTARAGLAAALTALGVAVSPGSVAPFLLCATPGARDVRLALREQGIAVRRGDTFPGLGRHHWRTAVRDAAAHDRLLDALNDVLCAG
ncbi:MAG: aminotransferase class, partial [Frankiales bacterium]|nr:aminotransferase class [Frankiales bacterium]